MDAEVQPGEADEENDQGARDRQAPPVLASEAQGVEQGKRAVQSDGDNHGQPIGGDLVQPVRIGQRRADSVCLRVLREHAGSALRQPLRSSPRTP